MLSLLFTGIFLICLIIVESLIAPIHFLGTLHFPGWLGLSAVILLLAWLMGD